MRTCVVEHEIEGKLEMDPWLQEYNPRRHVNFMPRTKTSYDIILCMQEEFNDPMAIKSFQVRVSIDMPNCKNEEMQHRDFPHHILHKLNLSLRTCEHPYCMCSNGDMCLPRFFVFVVSRELYCFEMCEVPWYALSSCLECLLFSFILRACFILQEPMSHSHYLKSPLVRRIFSMLLNTKQLALSKKII